MQKMKTPTRACGFNIACTLMVSIILTFSQAAFAHSEKEKARFVAENGINSGTCNNRFRPCKSIGYAVQQANKGDKILVAEGRYSVANQEDLLYLVSELQPVLGGFNTLDNYQVQQPDHFHSVLTGVPTEYADILYDKGFHVIVDTKGATTDQLDWSLKAVQQMQTTQPAAPCVGGVSAGFSCNNMSLLGRLPLSALPTNSSAANDIWGHVDLNTMREYAIIGLQRGVAVVDVTDPENPTVVGSISGQSTTWRDIKVYQFFSTAQQRWKAFAYASADSVTEGLTIIDLNTLPNGIKLVRRTLEDAEAHNVYISNIDYTTNTALPGASALLHITGSENYGGSWRTYNLKNAELPLASYQLDSGTRSDYTHDASSVSIDDERAQRDCVNAGNGACNVLIDFNENELRLWDHSSATAATELGSESYPNAEYVHSGWWSEDKQYVILHDELDEQRRGLNTTVHFFDISDLNSPTLVASWTGPTRAIDHNGFVRGNRYYMSNYERGVTILDISDPTAPTEIGNFDTFGPSDNASFNGTWGVYPYLPSGIILASDIQGGLYILKDETLGDLDDAVGFASTQISLDEGNTGNIKVTRQGNGAMSVDYQFISGSAGENDFNGSDGTLTWSDGDLADKTIPITINTDGFDETTEVFFVRLSNPVDGALKIEQNTAFVSINGTGVQRGTVGFNDATADVREIDGTVNFAVLRSGGSDQAISIEYAITGGDATLGVDVSLSDGILEWSDGDSENKFISVNILDDSESEFIESFTLTLSAANDGLLSDTRALKVSIRDDETNQPPFIDAGDDIQVNTRQTLSLAGSANDPENAEIQVVWVQTAGPSVTLNNADTLTPSLTAPNSAATLNFELQVTDDFNVTSTDTMTVIVNSPEITPPNNQGESSGGSLYWTGLIGLLSLIKLRRKSRNISV